MSTAKLPLFLLEIGCEEIPSRLLGRSVKELAKRLIKGLDGLGLAHGPVETFHTPRRLAVMVNVQAAQPDRSEELLGPPAKVGFDAEGNPTRAALGFAKRHGVDAGAIRKKSTPRGDYLAVTVNTVGLPAGELLGPLVTETLKAMPWPKAMRWGTNPQAFIRPVHWLVALLDDTIVPFSFAGIESGRISSGHRFLSVGPVSIDHPNTWVETLRANFVEADAAIRMQRIKTGVKTLADEVGGVVRDDAALYEEVLGLTEWPTALRGSFDTDFLDIPAEVLEISMKAHQRYFPVRAQDGALTEHFILIAGTIVDDPAIVIAGNQRVLRARLADARFFYDLDTQRAKDKGLEDFVEDLRHRVFLKGLGTMRQKAGRLSNLAGRLARFISPNDADAPARAMRAGLLAKADLSTGMVGEFPKLQGRMGRDYAETAGESVAISTAIEEHYWPRHATDILPVTPVGTAVALADRLDNIVGCYALGLEPTGSADPYALRRQALGVLRILMEHEDAPTLGQAVETAATIHDDDVSEDWDAVTSRVQAFFRARMKHFLAADYPTDLVEAVLGAGTNTPRRVLGRLKALAALKSGDGWDALATSVKRVVRIVSDQEVVHFESEDLVGDAEIGLYQAFEVASTAAEAAFDADDYDTALQAMVALEPPIARFFEDVMVLSDDADERARRVGLLAVVASLFHRVADFSKVST